MRISNITFRSNKHGFTLMETALALLVIGLAFLGILGLGRSGLDAVKEAGNDTRYEAMADAIFDTLQTYNYLFDDYVRTNQQDKTWAAMWSDAPIPFPTVSGMATNSLPLLINSENVVNAYDTGNISLNNWNPRYQLGMKSKRTSSVTTQDNIAYFILFIYPDGDTYSSERRIYTTVINRPGVL